MKKIFILFIGSVILLCTQASAKKNTTTVKDRLTFMAENLESSFKNSYDIFFRCFPSSFSDFDSIYGYDENSGKAQLLYEVYEPHINYLFDMKSNVNINEFMEKIFCISLNGRWMADNVSIFQTRIIDFINTNPKVFLEFLIEKNSTDIMSFWGFILDNAYEVGVEGSSKALYVTLYETINKLNSIQAELIKRQYNVMFNNNSKTTN